MSKKVLFICTSAKDRSPALVDYFDALNPQNEYHARGINKYFCKKHGTTLVEWKDILWADIIVFCEPIHFHVVQERYKGKPVFRNEGGTLEYVAPAHTVDFIILECGNYQPGPLAEDYLTRAERKLNHLIKT